MQKLLIRLALATAIVGALVYGALAFGFYEPRNVDPKSMIARVLLPSPIRLAPLPGQCGTAKISKSLIECGGICGERFDLQYMTTSRYEDIRKSLTNYASDQLAGFEVEVLEQGEPAACHEAHVSFSRMW